MILCVILVSACFYIGLRFACVSIPENIELMKEAYKNAPDE